MIVLCCVFVGLVIVSLKRKHIVLLVDLKCIPESSVITLILENVS